MKRLLTILACVALALPAPVFAQGNDDDYTPLNSRIKRARQFPLDTKRTWDPQYVSEVNRKRSRVMVSQFSKCLYNRSNEKSLDLLARTDFGFVNFDQVGMEVEQVKRVHGFNDCLRRVASTNNTSVVLRFYAAGLRSWLLQEAYFDLYPDQPEWVTPGNVVAERTYPLSERNPGVHAAMDFADCIVANDPYGADIFFRTPAGTDDERKTLEALVPSVSPCLPEGVQTQIEPTSFRVWIGEALWHAANHNGPPPPEGTEDVSAADSEVTVQAGPDVETEMAGCIVRKDPALGRAIVDAPSQEAFSQSMGKAFALCPMNVSQLSMGRFYTALYAALDAIDADGSAE